jgi:hypothetical protein
LLAAAIISLLVMGTSVSPMQSNVYAQTDTADEKRSIQQETTAQSANQKAGQDNTCVRDESCEQANQGQQIAGENNEATGFNDQSANVQSPTSQGGQPTQQPTQQPTPDVTPDVTPTGTCTACFAALLLTLTPSEENALLTALGLPTTGSTSAALCSHGVIIDESVLRGALGPGGAVQLVAGANNPFVGGSVDLDLLLLCLAQEGVHIVP